MSEVSKSASSVSMTEGNIWKKIIFFAAPLILGNLFQQLYNTADSVVVGRFIGREALAAVGSSGSLINLLVGLFAGIATGAGVIISQFFGAREYEKLKLAVHTAVFLSIIGGVLLIGIGIVLSPVLLEMMGTPEEVMPNSVLYLRIFFLGSLFNLFYNMGAGMMRAVGNSIYPLYCLIVASVVNIILDILFVAVFGFGIAGVGYATIMAQGVAALLILLKMLRAKDSHYHLIPSELKPNVQMIRRILNIGISSGIQGSIISVSNVIVQANINVFGAFVMAGCGSYMKIDGFVLLPVMSFSMAAMTFTGQNVGAGKTDRVKKGIGITVALSSLYILFISVILYLFGENLIGIFNKEQEVIKYGLLMLRILIPFYLTISVVNILTSAFRGAGKSMAAMLIMVLNLCIVRMLWVNIMVQFYPRIETVLWGYPVSWITGLICCLLYLWKGKWLKTVE